MHGETQLKNVQHVDIKSHYQRDLQNHQCIGQTNSVAGIIYGVYTGRICETFLKCTPEEFYNFYYEEFENFNNDEDNEILSNKDFREHIKSFSEEYQETFHYTERLLMITSRKERFIKDEEYRKTLKQEHYELYSDIFRSILEEQLNKL